MMFKLPLLFIVALPLMGLAQEIPKTLKFNYRNSDLTKVLEDYAAASGRRVIIDPQIKGSITIINPEPITLEEAYNQLSTALAVNGVGFTQSESVLTARPARMIQRDNIPVVTELPPLRPERMVTWIVNLKHISADEVNKQLRILTSRDGELVPYTPTNQLLVSDWTPNLHRIAAIVKNIDTPASVAQGRASSRPAHLVRPAKKSSPANP
jgi:general secretion pathway protein D